MGVIKPLLIGLLMLTGMYFAFFNFYTYSLNDYNLTNTTGASVLTNTGLLLSNITSEVDTYQEITTDGTELSGFSLLGFVFSGFLQLAKNFINLPAIIASIITDLINLTPVALPSWIPNLISGVLIVIVLSAIIAYFLGRGLKEV